MHQTSTGPHSLQKLSRAVVDKVPFPHCSISGMFSDEFLVELRSQVLSLKFTHKSNDLYEFHQSADLCNVSSAIGTTKAAGGRIQELVHLLYSPQFIAQMSQLLGIPLSGTVDLSAHRYPSNGYLLCHDDDIGTDDDGRRIAFILYLVEKDWSSADGGTLSLFDSDANGDPTFVVKSIQPQFGQISFFQVLPTSHHQVDLVCGGRERVSISGWFHGPKSMPKEIDYRGVLSRWFNPVYLTADAIDAIIAKMSEDGCVQLREILKKDVYQALLKEFSAAKFDTRVGIANQHRYHQVSDAQDMTLLVEFRQLMSSGEFRWFLEEIAQMELEPSQATLRAFQTGDYTLMNDKNMEKPGLDVMFIVNTRALKNGASKNTKEHPGPEMQLEQQSQEATEWDDEWGGATHYFSDSETLLSLYPQDNTLNIVLRDSGIMRFVKLVNSSAQLERRECSITLQERAEICSETRAEFLVQ